MSGRAVPRAEGVTFASGSGGMRMEKGRSAAAAGQPLFFRSGRLSDPPLGGHFPGNSRTRVLVCEFQNRTTQKTEQRRLCVVLVCLSAPSTVCLHGTGGCASCRDGS